MDHWELDFEWIQLQHQLKALFNKDQLPDLNAVLFLIGMQELGQVKSTFSKEEKQDLMHIAICRLLSEEGYFEFEGIDTEGWPHWKMVRKMPFKTLKDQEDMLKIHVIKYFKNQLAS